jgi:hypothetical protein
MHSDLINKIEKAKRYAQQPERFAVEQFQVRFKGSSGDHLITLQGDEWSCDCNFYKSWNTCSHIMALQRMLGPMLSEHARRASGPEYVSEQLIEAAG